MGRFVAQQWVAPTGIPPSPLTSLPQPQPVTREIITTNAFAPLSDEHLSDDQAWDTVAKRRTHRRISKKEDPEPKTQQCNDCNVIFTLENALILWYVQTGLHVPLRCEVCRTLNKNRNSQQSPSRPASPPTKLPFIPDTRPPLMHAKPKEVQPLVPEMNSINYPALQSTKNKSQCQQQHEESSDEQDDDVDNDFQDSEVTDPNIDMNLEHEDPPNEQHSDEENNSQDSELPSLQSRSSSFNSGSIQESRP